MGTADMATADMATADLPATKSREAIVTDWIGDRKMLAAADLRTRITRATTARETRLIAMDSVEDTLSVTDSSAAVTAVGKNLKAPFLD
jgi:hypothetical protein